MASVNARIETPMISERIRHARLAAAMTQDEVVAALSASGETTLTKAGLSKYERGGSIPKPVMLRALGKVFGVPAAFFLEEPQIGIRWLGFRKGASMRKADQERVKAIAAAHADAFISLWRSLEPGASRSATKPRRVRSPEDAELVADWLRSEWNLGEQPIESVASAIEDNGGIVLELGAPVDAFEGLSGWADESVPMVVVSPAGSDDRRRFSLAHELGHLFMDVGDVDEKTEERLAHRFAAALLVPGNVARKELGAKRRHLDLRELALLKLKFGLSMQAWIFRAADLGIIDQAHARTLYAEFGARGWRKLEPVTFTGRESPLKLRQLTVRGLAEGLLTRLQAERICPQALSDSLDDRPAEPGSMDARTLMKLPNAERERLMEQAAALVERDYRDGGALRGFDALTEDDHRERSIEN